MKTRATKEQIAAFLSQNSQIELISHKSGWATFDSETLEQDRIQQDWTDFCEDGIDQIAANQGFGESKLNLERIAADIAPEINGEVSTDEKPEEEVEVSYHEQLDYKGNVELLPDNEYVVRVECECGNVRWVKTSDEFQVFACKPCTIRQRRQRAAQRRKEKRQRIRAMEAAAAGQEWEDTNAELMAEAQ